MRIYTPGNVKGKIYYPKKTTFDKNIKHVHLVFDRNTGKFSVKEPLDFETIIVDNFFDLEYVWKIVKRPFGRKLTFSVTRSGRLIKGNCFISVADIERSGVLFWKEFIGEVSFLLPVGNLSFVVNIGHRIHFCFNNTVVPSNFSSNGNESVTFNVTDEVNNELESALIVTYDGNEIVDVRHTNEEGKAILNVNKDRIYTTYITFPKRDAWRFKWQIREGEKIVIEQTTPTFNAFL